MLGVNGVSLPRYPTSARRLVFLEMLSPDLGYFISSPLQAILFSGIYFLAQLCDQFLVTVHSSKPKRWVVGRSHACFILCQVIGEWSFSSSEVSVSSIQNYRLDKFPLLVTLLFASQGILPTSYKVFFFGFIQDLYLSFQDSIGMLYLVEGIAKFVNFLFWKTKSEEIHKLEFLASDRHFFC